MRIVDGSHGKVFTRGEIARRNGRVMLRDSRGSRGFAPGETPRAGPATRPQRRYASPFTNPGGCRMTSGSPRLRTCTAVLAIALGGCASGPGAPWRETAGCDLLSGRPETFADARMLELRFSQDGNGCRVTGIAPSPRVAAAQQRAIEALAASRCGAGAASSSIVEKMRDGVPVEVLAMRIEPPPGPLRCEPGETGGAGQVSVDISSSRMHPPRYPPAAARAGIGGRATMRVLVDEHGGVAAALVESSSGHAALDDAAYEAVLRWRFQRSGTGLVVARVPIDFDPG
ncbi:energy transducer TonB [Luteimonas sp. Y-2-2-4F]|nr:energy transducer TonB [Luteimonas sp. Y-2-2-4F]